MTLNEHATNVIADAKARLGNKIWIEYIPQYEEVVVVDCRCDVDEAKPERIAFDTKFTYQCMNCGGGVTDEGNNNFNRYWGFSGYDEYEGAFEGHEEEDE